MDRPAVSHSLQHDAFILFVNTQMMIAFIQRTGHLIVGPIGGPHGDIILFGPDALFQIFAIPVQEERDFTIAVYPDFDSELRILGGVKVKGSGKRGSRNIPLVGRLPEIV